MMKAGGLSVLCLVVLLLLVETSSASPTQLTYHVGQEVAFALHSEVNARHVDAQTLQAGGGSVAYMDSTVVCRCTQMDATSYLFVMNMYDTHMSVTQNAGTSSERTGEPIVLGLGRSSALGDPVYFKQLKTGEITNVWYKKGHLPYFINVKAGAINAFQTRIIPADKQAKYEETDIIGVHSSNFVGLSASGGLNIVKTYNQVDFKTFATDPNLSNKDIILNVHQGVSVHSSGYIQSTSFDQRVLLVQTNTKQAKRNNNDSLDVFMLSHGKMNVNLQRVSTVTGKQKTGSSVFEDSEAFGTRLSYVSACFTFLLRWRQAKNWSNSASPRQIMQMQAIITAATLNAPTVQLAGSLFSIYHAAEDSPMKHAALLAYGAVLSKLNDPVQIYTGGEALLNILESTPDSDAKQLSTVFAAIKNAGPSVISPSRVLFRALSLCKKGTMLHHTSAVDLLALTGVSRTLAKDPMLKASLKRLVEEYVAKGSELELAFATVIEDSDYPFNCSWAKDLVVGGRTINLDLKGQLFVGTNFGCNHKYFNYKAFAQILDDVTLFTKTANVFKAEAIYGAENGVHLADEISLVFLGRTIYSKPLCQIDCQEHTYQLYQCYK